MWGIILAKGGIERVSPPLSVPAFAEIKGRGGNRKQDDGCI